MAEPLCVESSPSTSADHQNMCGTKVTQMESKQQEMQVSVWPENLQLLVPTKSHHLVEEKQAAHLKGQLSH